MFFFLNLSIYSTFFTGFLLFANYFFVYPVLFVSVITHLNFICLVHLTSFTLACSNNNSVCLLIIPFTYYIYLPYLFLLFSVIFLSFTFHVWLLSCSVAACHFRNIFCFILLFSFLLFSYFSYYLILIIL